MSEIIKEAIERQQRVWRARDESPVTEDGLLSDIAAYVISQRVLGTWRDMASTLPQAVTRTFESIGFTEGSSPSFVFCHMAIVLGFLGDDMPTWLEETHLISYGNGEDIRTLVDAMLEDES